MTIDLTTLFSAGLAYLFVLFLVAYATERGLVPARWLQSPVTYSLSLCVYATSWSYYGSVGFAQEHGLLFLTIYLGVTLAFFLTPFLLEPVLRVTREHQLASLADLFAFRYRSQAAGVLVTLFMLVGALPYIALQIRAVTESLSVLSQEVPPVSIALGFVVTLTVFAILFGARHISPREKHQGLVAAIAFESLVKLIAILSAGIYAIFGVFGGPGGLESWLAERPDLIVRLYQPVREGPWGSLLLLSFAAAFLLPRQFHMIFTENLEPRALRMASWGFPLLLLMMNLPILPILWAAKFLDLTVPPEYSILGLTLYHGHGIFTLLAFLGGLSAASAMVIVSTLSLSYMALNHLLLPASYPDPKINLYRWLLWGRRLLIFLILFAGFGFYALLEHHEGLVQLGLISFVAAAQFIPGMVGLLYWREANRWGFISGLLAGIAVWYFTLLHPLLAASGLAPALTHPLDWMLQAGIDKWEFATFVSLAVNGLLFMSVSALTPQSQTEREAAEACGTGRMTSPTGMVTATSPADFSRELASLVGADTARREVKLALADLGLDAQEERPAELRRLRDQLEKNLSGLLGPAMSHVIINQKLLLDPDTRTAFAESVRHLEKRLETSRSQMRGLAADLDRLRRYHRRLLMDLPIGVCAVNERFEVVLWNSAMEITSGIRAAAALDKKLTDLIRPWSDLLYGLARSRDAHAPSIKTMVDGRRRWFNLYRAALSDSGDDTQFGGGLVFLVEDRTALESLEAELAHSDRLASIGRLAAGVAHEIGNPVTAIASLAQLMRDETGDAGMRDSVESILEQTARITVILRTLSGFAHGGAGRAPRFEAVDLAAIIADAIKLLSLSDRGKAIRFVCHCPEQTRVHGNAQQLSQVLVNLLSNACDASTPGQKIVVSARSADAGRVLVQVEDEGRGMAAAELDLVFEPFYTSKEPGQGIGLGLAVVYRIVQQHQGTIEIHSEPGQGTQVVVTLPAA